MVMLGKWQAEEIDCCPICGGEGRFVMTAPDPSQGEIITLNVYECKKCSCAYNNPRMTKDAMNDYYQSGDYIKGFENYDDFGERRRAMVRALLISEYVNINQPKRALDVGCGHGYFLQRMRDWVRNIDTVGYDLYVHPDAVHEVITDKNEITGTFDFISCIHVLEHTYNPLGELAWMDSLLDPGGFLFLELPTKRKIMLEHPIVFSPDAVPVLMDHINIGTYTRLDVPNLESSIVFGKKSKIQ